MAGRQARVRPAEHAPDPGLPRPAQVRSVRDQDAPGPVYRPVNGEAAELIAVALKLGKFYRNVASAIEGTGHRSCMIYSAIVCPYLASPGARRKFEVNVGPEIVPRGDPRGSSAAVVGYDSYSWEVSAQGIEILYGQPVELLSYANGTDLLAEIAQERGRARRARRTCWMTTLRPSGPHGPYSIAVPPGLPLHASKTGSGRTAGRAPGRRVARTGDVSAPVTAALSAVSILYCGIELPTRPAAAAASNRLPLTDLPPRVQAFLVPVPLTPATLRKLV